MKGQWPLVRSGQVRSGTMDREVFLLRSKCSLLDVHAGQLEGARARLIRKLAEVQRGLGKDEGLR